MIIYLAIFGAFALLAITKLWKPGSFGAIAVTIAIFLTVFVGYRYYIGVDWVTYEIIFLDIARMSLIDAIAYGDSAYSLINWIVAQFGGQVWHVNLICAGLFSFALVQFCKCLPRPALALAVSVPTLIIITAMGYTRQASAVACVMLAFNQFKGGISWRWFGWLCLAILFHRSAIVVLPIFIVSGSRQRWLSIAIGGIVIAGLLFSVVLQNFSDILSLYFEGDIESSGAIPRIAVGAIAGLAYFAVKDKTKFGDRETLVRNMAISLIAMLPLYTIIPSTTVIDRIGVLLLPFQSAILSGFASSFEDNHFLEVGATSLILVFYCAILIVWLMFATFASYWIPYENVFFVKWI